jgi:hypothetical protein
VPVMTRIYLHLYLLTSCVDTRPFLAARPMTHHCGCEEWWSKPFMLEGIQFTSLESLPFPPICIMVDGQRWRMLQSSFTNFLRCTRLLVFIFATVAFPWVPPTPQRLSPASLPSDLFGCTPVANTWAHRAATGNYDPRLGSFYH